MTFLLFFVLLPLTQVADTGDENMIISKLNNQAICWNKGDIDCFMNDYWHDDSLMYIGKNGVTYGWQKTLDRYKRNYPSAKEMGQLEFKIIKLEQLDDHHYFMVGKWSLKREIGDLEGHFTLVWKKINNVWVIIADHSS